MNFHSYDSTFQPLKLFYSICNNTNTNTTTTTNNNNNNNNMSNVFSTVVLIGDTVNKQTNIVNIT